jgi:NADPH:quinone reductase-like Zn-dependent oxidoreductase
MNDQMKAISQDELGGPEVLELVTLPTPEPGVGEVLVRVHAASVNPVDAMNRESGLFIGQPPFVLGWDVSGTVEAVGLGVTLYAPGDEVFGMLPFPHGHGAHAQYAVGPTRVFVLSRTGSTTSRRRPYPWSASLRGRPWWRPPMSARAAAC